MARKAAPAAEVVARALNAARPTPQQKKLKSEVVKVFSSDTFQNLLTRTGLQAGNLSSGNSYSFNPISRNRTLIEWMYRGSWICGVAVDCVADDMTREGIELSSALDIEVKEELEELIRNFQIWQSLNMVAKNARLYGGGLGYIYIDGQNPATPLRVSSVGPGAFKGIIPLDQWMVTPQLNSGITDPGPDYGNPKFYTITATSPQFPFPRTRVHYTRFIRMLGIELPYWQRTMENMWGISILERIYDRLTAFDSTTQGAAQLVYRAYLRTYAVENLREIIAAGGPSFEALVKQIELTRLYQSNEGMTLMDTKDKFEAHQYSFGGLSDVMDKMAEQISGATQIPLARLFGQSPSGLNSTGDHDLRTYYDNIKRQQERWFRRPLDVILRVIAASEGLEIPDGFIYEFASLWQMTDDEKSTADNNDTTAVNNTFSNNIVSRAQALKELRMRGRSTGRWQTITDEDIAEAEEEDEAPPVDGLLDQKQQPSVPQIGQDPRSPQGTGTKDSSRILDWHDLPIHIETRKGETRVGKGWKTLMPADYGFIHGVPSAEGGQEELDCYLGPYWDSDQVFIVNQRNIGKGSFDEHKVMLGFRNEAEAKATYEAAFSDGKGWARCKNIVPMTLDKFKAWMKSADLTQEAA